jgi:transcriptional regulator with XRE-family HTH domain
MVIGERLKQLREEKGMSQGDIETKTGLLRCYISRVENGHTVPSIETLEKMANSMEIPLYQLFGGKDLPGVKSISGSRAKREDAVASLLESMSVPNRKLFVAIGKVLARCWQGENARPRRGEGETALARGPNAPPKTLSPKSPTRAKTRGLPRAN